MSLARRMSGAGLRRDLRAPKSASGDAELATLDGTTRFRGRADAYNATTGDLTDTGGEGNDAAQGTAGNRPAAGTRFGRPSMEFDGVNDYVQTGAFSGGACTLPTTIFVFGELDGVGVNRGMIDGRISSNRNVIWWQSTNVWNMLGATSVPMSGGNATDSTVTSFACEFNGASSIGYFDDWSTDICPGNCGTHVLEGLTIGAAFNGTLHFIGGICEVIVVEGASAADYNRVSSYGSDYYGRTIT